MAFPPSARVAVGVGYGGVPTVTVGVSVLTYFLGGGFDFQIRSVFGSTNQSLIGSPCYRDRRFKIIRSHESPTFFAAVIEEPSHWFEESEGVIESLRVHSD